LRALSFFVPLGGPIQDLGPFFALEADPDHVFLPNKGKRRKPNEGEREDGKERASI
jgi:hypothetical protein